MCELHVKNPTQTRVKKRNTKRAFNTRVSMTKLELKRYLNSKLNANNATAHYCVAEGTVGDGTKELVK